MRFKTGGSKCSALVALGLIPTTCWSAIIWDEATQGDLSGDRFAPTSLTLTLGDNSLSATSQGGDLEYVTITVSEGELLSGLVLRSYSGSDGRAFIGIQAGTTFTEPPTTQSAANLLGWTHFGTSEGNVGADLLPQIGSGAGAQGFTPPLPADSYTLWLQQLGSPTTYQLDFAVTPVPEPAGTTFCAAALLVATGLIHRIRRRQGGG